jgi:hypothetical protein
MGVKHRRVEEKCHRQIEHLKVKTLNTQYTQNKTQREQFIITVNASVSFVCVCLYVVKIIMAPFLIFD